MKILYINIYEGCEEPERFENLTRFIKKVNPDFLGLSELNQWQNNNYQKLKEFEEKSGLKNVAFAHATSGYNLGIFSNQKNTYKKIITRSFKTGMIRTDFKYKNQDLCLILTHLHSENEDLRLKELKTVLANAPKDIYCLLMGDLNSLSPQDFYDKEKLLRFMKSINSSKFGTTSIRMDVIKKIESFGFMDCIKKFSKKFEYSVPSPYNKDKEHFQKLRLDYFFTNKQLFQFLKSAQIIRNKETDQLSDHYPILAEFRL